MLDANVTEDVKQYNSDYVTLNSITRGILLEFMNASTLSLRHIQQAAFRLGLALTSIESGVRRSFPAFALVYLLRTIDSDIYHKFIRSEITDKDVSEYMFSLPGISELKRTNMGVSFEAILILADEKFRKGETKIPPYSSSSLFRHYRSIVAGNTESSLKSHAEFVLRDFERYNEEYSRVGANSYIGFRAAAKHIELLYDMLPDDYA